MPEEDAEVPEAHLARMGHTAAADEAGFRHGVMRRPERAEGDEALAGGEQARHAPDRRDLDGLIQRERWENGGQPPGQHGLARAGRAEHEQVVVDCQPRGYVLVVPTLSP